jgi:hypothetical protein
VVLLLLLYAFPPVLLVSGSARLAWCGLCAYALGVLSRVVAATATGGRAWPDALAQPISIVLFGWLVARTCRRRVAVDGGGVDDPVGQ